MYSIISNGMVVAEDRDLDALIDRAGARARGTLATVRIYVGQRVRYGVEPTGEVWRIDSSGVPATVGWLQD